MSSTKRMLLPPATGEIGPPVLPRRQFEPPAEPKYSIDLPGSLRRHWVISLVVMLAVLTLGGFALRKVARRVYYTHSEVYLSPKFPKVLVGDTETEHSYDSYVEDQVQTVTRRDIIAEAIERLPYEVRHRTGPALPYEILVLQNLLRVQRIRSSYEIEIGIDGPSPAGLAETVNAITDTYVEKSKGQEFYGLEQRLATLEAEKARLRQEIDTRLTEQAELLKQLGVATISSVQGNSNPYDSTVEQIRQQAVTARAQREAAEAQLSAVSQAGSGSGSSIAESAIDDAIAADPALAATRTALNTRRATLLSEMSGLTTDHPLYRRDQNEINSLDSSVGELRRKAAERVKDRLREEVNRTRMIEVQREREVAQKTHSASAAAPKFQRAIELGPEIDNLQKASAAVDDRIRELSLESSSPGSIHVSSRAQMPLGPENGKFLQALIALIVATLILGMAVPILLDMLDGHIFTAIDIERAVGFHPIATLMDQDQFSSTITNEYYFRLAAGIEHAVRQTSARSFLFTSPTHECGTSTIVRELSRRLGQLGLKTKVIISGMDGVQATEPHVVQPTADGKGRPNVISNSTMGLALSQAAGEYDIILLDANPLPLSAYTEYLARMSDVTVMVVRAGTSTKAELKRAAKLLERLEVAGVAVVLNQVTRERADTALRRELMNYEKRPERRAKRRQTSILVHPED